MVARLIPLISLIPLLLALVASAACAASNPAAAPGGYAGCARQQATCEAACEPRELPGSTEKEPAMRGDLEAERCREQCRTGGCTGP